MPIIWWRQDSFVQVVSSHFIGRRQFIACLNHGGGCLDSLLQLQSAIMLWLRVGGIFLLAFPFAVLIFGRLLIGELMRLSFTTRWCVLSPDSITLSSCVAMAEVPFAAIPFFWFVEFGAVWSLLHPRGFVVLGAACVLTLFCLLFLSVSRLFNSTVPEHVNVAFLASFMNHLKSIFCK